MLNRKQLNKYLREFPSIIFDTPLKFVGTYKSGGDLFVQYRNSNSCTRLILFTKELQHGSTYLVMFNTWMFTTSDKIVFRKGIQIFIRVTL